MSNRGGEPSAASHVPALAPLEAAVERAVEEIRAVRERAAQAEARAERSEQLLRQFVDGREDPGELANRVAELEAENENLRARIEQGREGVDSILASIRFLEDRR
ncbi:MAG: hypothetical protein OXN18_12535 [Gemmatimonadota bacterium]|nr:hypothetical protein [Gemmatimonadota bacterium]